MLNSRMLASSIRAVSAVVVWLVFAACVYSIADDKYSQWDFNVYYSAAHALAGGKNPYAVIHPFPGLRPDRLFYVYPPLTLYFFQWTTLLPQAAARLVWLGLRLLALAALVRLWHKEFERLNAGAPVTLFLAVGFNAALLRDFTAGNISTFEQLGIWLGFSLLTRQRLYAAAVIFACIGQFKFFPAAFMGLIPMVAPREGWKPLTTGCALFLALFSLNAVITPGLFHNYFGLLSDAKALADDRGVINPSALALFRDILDSTSYTNGLPDNVRAGTLVYGFYFAILTLSLIRVLWSKRDLLSKCDPRLVVYLGCAVFALAMPRLKDYSYAIMLIPALFVIRDLDRRRLVPNYLMLGAALLAWGQPQQNYVPGMQVLIYLLQAYLPLVMTAAILIYLLQNLLGSGMETTVVPDEPRAVDWQPTPPARSVASRVPTE